MSDDVLLVDFGALRQASADIGRAVETLRSQLDELEREARPLVASWDGPAREAYERRQAQWRQAAAHLTSILHDIKIALDGSAADYLDTEQRNVALFQ